MKISDFLNSFHINIFTIFFKNSNLFGITEVNIFESLQGKTERFQKSSAEFLTFVNIGSDFSCQLLKINEFH